jgi:hypothetical protein
MLREKETPPQTPQKIWRRIGSPQNVSHDLPLEAQTVTKTTLRHQDIATTDFCAKKECKQKKRTMLNRLNKSR